MCDDINSPYIDDPLSDDEFDLPEEENYSNEEVVNEKGTSPNSNSDSEDQPGPSKRFKEY